jgi:hypothetical protein
MSGGNEETPASYEARFAPRSYPTEGRGWPAMVAATRARSRKRWIRAKRTLYGRDQFSPTRSVPVSGEPTVPRRGWSLADRVLIADAARDADGPVLVRSRSRGSQGRADRDGRPSPEQSRGRSRWRPVSRGSNLRRAGHASTGKSSPEASLPRRPRVRGRRSAGPDDDQSAHRGSGQPEPARASSAWPQEMIFPARRRARRAARASGANVLLHRSVKRH